MGLRISRAAVGLVLVASGALMYAASWQRWASVCSWGVTETGRCLLRQDHRYDFVTPAAPWEPIGHAAELAGGSLLALALGWVLLPWALTGRLPGGRPRLVLAVSVAGVVLGLADCGVATLRSGLAGRVVEPLVPLLPGIFAVFVLPVLLLALAVFARGWSRAAAGLLFVGSPLVAGLCYANGPYDAQPWWEGVSGAFTALAGLCLLATAALGSRTVTPRFVSRSVQWFNDVGTRSRPTSPV